MTTDLDITWTKKGKEQLKSLADDEKFTFELEGKEFIMITKHSYELYKIKEKAFDMLSKK